MTLENAAPLEIVTALVALANTNGGEIIAINDPALWGEVQSLLAVCRPALDDVTIVPNPNEIRIRVARAQQIHALPDGRVMACFHDDIRQLNTLQIKTLMQARIVGDFDAELAPNGQTVADLLLENNDPQAWLPMASIEIQRFSEGELSAHHQVTGHLLQQIEQTVALLHETDTRFSSSTLQELVVNAVAHRNYRLQDVIRFTVDDHRIVCDTPADLPPIADINALDQQHYWRNPHVVEKLVKAGWMRGVGAGLQALPATPNLHLSYHTISHTLLQFRLELIAEPTDVLLNWRQKRVLNYVRQHGSINEHMLGVLFDNMPPPDLQKDMLELVATGRLTLISRLRGNIYLSKQ